VRCTYWYTYLFACRRRMPRRCHIWKCGASRNENRASRLKKIPTTLQPRNINIRFPFPRTIGPSSFLHHIRSSCTRTTRPQCRRDWLSERQLAYPAYHHSRAHSLASPTLPRLSVDSSTTLLRGAYRRKRHRPRRAYLPARRRARGHRNRAVLRSGAFSVSLTSYVTALPTR
jgi:hypothetical protein